MNWYSNSDGYPSKQAVTLPALHIVNDALRHVPLQAVVEIAEILELAPAQVQDALTFYGFFIEEGGRLDATLQFGPLRFEDPVVVVADRERLAGWHVLHHFVLTFDQRNSRIRMQRNGAGPVRPGPWVRWGLALRSSAEGRRVIRVFPGTTAEAAGLREGDLITAIDGTPVGELGCSDPQGDSAGRRFVLSYLRDGIQAEVEIEAEILVP